jgi:glycosyltransferase involved in cell wall biosynthesis
LTELFSKAGTHVAGIKLSRNCGHQNALLAGLFTATGDAVVRVDADLQDDVDAIREMDERFQSGAEIVYGVRRRRDTDSVFKCRSADLLRAVCVEADYWLLSRSAVDDLKQYREVNLYLCGIVPLLGYSAVAVSPGKASTRCAG